MVKSDQLWDRLMFNTRDDYDVDNEVETYSGQIPLVV